MRGDVVVVCRRRRRDLFSRSRTRRESLSLSLSSLLDGNVVADVFAVVVVVMVVGLLFFKIHFFR